MSGWNGSTRRQRLPRDWTARRARVLRRDPTCQACAVAVSTEVDHIVAGDDHDLSNLQGLCSACHLRKTNGERKTNRRPAESHPGLLQA